MTREKAQLTVVLVIVGLWAFSVVLAVFDGTTLAKVLTPIFSTMVGWLFAARVGG